MRALLLIILSWWRIIGIYYNCFGYQVANPLFVLITCCNQQTQYTKHWQKVNKVEHMFYKAAAKVHLKEIVVHCFYP